MINFKMIKFIFGFVLCMVPAFSQDTTDQEEREKFIKEYQEISERLMNLQKQALSDIEISKQAENFSNNLEDAMVKEDSSVLSKINRREEIVDKFENADKTGNQNEALMLQQEYQQITQQLMVHQQKVLLNNEELKKEGEELEEALLNKMKEIDPEVPKLVARLETLGSQIQGIKEDQKL